MSDGLIIQIMTNALYEVLILASPILGVSIVVGLIVSILQTTTSIQEQTLTFVPKIIAIFVTIVWIAGWLVNHMKMYTKGLFEMLSRF